MASDFWPHGEVAGKYGILRTTEPLAVINERAVFVVDKAGNERVLLGVPFRAEDLASDLKKLLKE